MRGGISDYTDNLVRALISQSARVRVICGAASVGELDEVPVERVIRSWGWKCLPELAGLAGKYQPDWVHIQYNVGLYDGKAAVLFAPLWLKRTHPTMRTAVTFHDLRHPRVIPKIHAINRWLFSQGMALYDLIVTTNEGDYLTARKALNHQDALRKIPIGSNIPVIPVSPDERVRLRARIGFGAEDFVIAHFGTRSGMETLIESFCLLRGAGHAVGLLLVGKRLQADPDEATHEREVVGARVMAQVVQDSVGGKVVGTGYLSELDASRHLQCADVLVLPHRSGISMARTSLLTGLVHGMPIVATRPMVLDPELQDGCNILLVEPANALMLAEAILLLRRDHSLRLGLQSEALALGSQITWSAIAQQHIAVYEEMA